LRRTHREEDRYAPVLEAVLIARQGPIVRERVHRLEYEVVLIGTESTLAQPQDVGLLIVE
jgi:hypothetical protein